MALLRLEVLDDSRSSPMPGFLTLKSASCPRRDLEELVELIAGT